MDLPIDYTLVQYTLDYGYRREIQVLSRYTNALHLTESIIIIYTDGFTTRDVDGCETLSEQ